MDDLERLAANNTPASVLLKIAQVAGSGVAALVGGHPNATREVLLAVALSAPKIVAPRLRAPVPLEIAVALGSEPGCHPSVLSQLSDPLSPLGAEAIACNPSVDTPLLESVVDALKEEDFWPTGMRAGVANRLAEHPALSKRAQAELLKHPDPHIRAAVLSRPDARSEWLAQALADTAPSVRAALVVHSHLHQRLATDPDPLVRCAVAGVAPAKLAAVLVFDSEHAVQLAAARNPQLPAELYWEQHALRAFAAGALGAQHQRDLLAGTALERLNLCTQPELSTAALHALAQDPETAVQAALATRKDLPPATFQILATQGLQVRLALSLDPSRFEAFLSDSSPAVRARVAQATPTDAHHQHFLLDTDSGVRTALASNASLRQETLILLAGDPHPSVRRAAQRHPFRTRQVAAVVVENPLAEWERARDRNASAELLRTLSLSSDPKVRREVATHKNTPTDVLKTLRQDPDQEVTRRVQLRRKWWQF